MTQNKQNGISIANVLALVGLATIGVIVFFGSLLASPDGKPFVAIAMAVAAIVLLSLTLYLSIHAKGVTKDFGPWRYVEIVSLLAYVGIAVAFSFSFNRFFYINFECKKGLQKQARSEIQQIRTMYNEYESQVTSLIDAASEQLQNYIDSKQPLNANQALFDYVYGDEGIHEDIDGWKEKAVKVTTLPADVELKALANRVENWNLLDVPQLAEDLKEKADKAWVEVEKYITEYGENQKLIPSISGGGDYGYRLEGLATIDLGDPFDSRFAGMLKKADGATWMGWVVYVLLNLLVLLNYLVAPRSAIVSPRVNSDRRERML